MSKVKRCIGVFTSGGDAPGMNAAVRAVVRCGINSGADVYAIYEGYQGMVDGHEHIKKMGWSDVAGILELGGTVIGSARCMDFKERSGRLTACKNLVDRGINHLVCIGGDGSLTGADLFKKEWKSLVSELLETDRIEKSDAERYGYLNIVGLVGSIDNDMCGTEYTIGCDTALLRIIEAVDCLQSTAVSHQRSFVVEVMGRNCGWLALNAGIACGADYVFIPENPPDVDDWKQHMCENLQQSRRGGHRMNLVLVAEGAIDKHGNAITAQAIKDVLSKEAGQDVRITVLGHVQRGGAPTAFDRIMSSTCGAEAVKVVLGSSPDATPMVIGLEGNKIIRFPLVENIQLTKDIGTALKNLDFAKARELRGPSFNNSLRIFRKVNKVKSTISGDDLELKRRIAILNVGAPACGMNSAARAAARYVMDKGHEVVGFYDGFEGVITDNHVLFDWMTVKGWWNRAGCELGTNRKLPDGHFDTIAKVFKKHKIQGVVCIGGFEGYLSLLQMSKVRLKHKPFCIPMVLIPATISNNVPGSQISLGSDTALNTICQAVDTIRLSANASRRRVFLVEVMGGYCSYLAVLGSLATGSEIAYKHEDNLDLNRIQADVHMLSDRFRKGAFCGVILYNEMTSKAYTTELLKTIYNEEGKDQFTTRTTVLGHLQQGHSPSPFDRVRGTELGSLAVDRILEHIKEYSDGVDEVFDNADDGVCVVGFLGNTIGFTSVEELADEVDFDLRLPHYKWWDKLTALMDMFGKFRGSKLVRRESKIF
eukprot:Nk52_evm22s2506 gene=Nk52_evmTU22s2506